MTLWQREERELLGHRRRIVFPYVYGISSETHSSEMTMKLNWCVRSSLAKTRKKDYSR